MIHEIAFSFHELIIDRARLEATLGFSNGLEEPFETYLNEAWDFSSSLKDIRAAYIIIDPIEFVGSSTEMLAEGLTFNLGRMIKKEVRDSSKVAFFICTAGETISTKSKLLMHGDDPALGYVYDVMGSFIVEAAGDKMQEQLAKEAMKNGDKITNRYSPGYCQWPVVDQHKIFSLFPENCCGVSLTQSALMDPVKSISGLIGIGKNVQFRDYVCALCNSKNCPYRILRKNSLSI